MQWSKLKSKLKDLLAPELCERVDFHLTRFRAAPEQVGRAWVTIDGDEILDCSYGRWFQTYKKTKTELLKCDRDKISGTDYLKISNRAIQQVRKAQVFSEKEFVASLTRFLDFSIKEALVSPDPFIRAFALVDRRLGKRTFEKVKIDESEHLLVQIFYKLRSEAFTQSN